MNNKKFLIGAIVAVVIVLIIAFAYKQYSDNTVAGESSEGNSASLSNTSVAPEENTNSMSAEGNSASGNSAAPTPAAKPKLSYAAALIEYTDKRIQLDANCGASPKEVTFKNGTNIMLDNRAGVARKIMFNAKAYSIPAYDFIVVAASSSTLPGITYLDCGDKQNVAKITIQK